MRKKKSFKLQLSRETLRDLEGQNLDTVVGGLSVVCTHTQNPSLCNRYSGCYSCDCVD
jgi:hypothetical protein